MPFVKDITFSESEPFGVAAVILTHENAVAICIHQGDNVLCIPLTEEGAESVALGLQVAVNTVRDRGLPKPTTEEVGHA